MSDIFTLKLARITADKTAGSSVSDELEGLTLCFLKQ
jgi:hypothetical protein